MNFLNRVVYAVHNDGLGSFDTSDAPDRYADIATAINMYNHILGEYQTYNEYCDPRRAGFAGFQYAKSNLTFTASLSGETDKLCAFLLENFSTEGVSSDDVQDILNSKTIPEVEEQTLSGLVKGILIVVLLKRIIGLYKMPVRATLMPNFGVFASKYFDLIFPKNIYGRMR